MVTMTIFLKILNGTIGLRFINFKTKKIFLYKNRKNMKNMNVIDKLKLIAEEAKQDNNITHYKVIQESIKEVERLKNQEEKLKIYEKIYGKICT